MPRQVVGSIVGLAVLAMVNMVVAASNGDAERCRPPAQLRREGGGAVTLWVAGKATAPLIFFGNFDMPDHAVVFDEIRLAASRGIHLHSITLALPWLMGRPADDVAGQRSKLRQVLDADPNGWIIPRMWMGAPGRWLDAHPGDRMTFANGEKYWAAITSPAWRRDATEQLRRFIRAIIDTPEGQRIIGIHPSYMNTGEWFYPQTTRYLGFSKVHREAYRDFAASSEGAAAAAKADVPTAAQRKGPDGPHAFLLGDDADNVARFYRFHSRAVVDAIAEIARACKEASGGRWLTFFFYGYGFEIINNYPGGPANSGHYALGQLLECPDVDVLCSPVSYMDRGAGGIGAPMSAADSVGLHGKLWLLEDDTRTHLAKDAGDSVYHGRLDTPEQTRQVTRRNFAYALTHGFGLWWMDLLSRGWWNSGAIWDDNAGLARLYEERMRERDRVLQPEVAVILHEASMFCLAGHNWLAKSAIYRARDAVARMGAGWGLYLASDLVAGRVPPAKLYVFLNAWASDERLAQWVRANVYQRGATAMWCYAPGVWDDGRLDAAGASQLSGIELALVTEAVDASSQPAGSPSQAGSGPAAGLKGSPGAKQSLSTVQQGGAGGRAGPAEGALLSAPVRAMRVTPTLHVVDRAARPEAYYAGSKRVSLAVKRMSASGGRAVFWGTPAHTPALLRSVCRLAGVHVYDDADDVVLVADGWLALHTRAAGQRAVRFPCAVDAVDALTGRVLATASDACVLEAAAGHTYLIRFRRH